MIAGIPAFESNISGTGNSIQYRGQTWVEVSLPFGGDGWVNSAYLAPWKLRDDFIGYCGYDDVPSGYVMVLGGITLCADQQLRTNLFAKKISADEYVKIIDHSWMQFESNEAHWGCLATLSRAIPAEYEKFYADEPGYCKKASDAVRASPMFGSLKRIGAVH